jgi:chromosome segregation protein
MREFAGRLEKLEQDLAQTKGKRTAAEEKYEKLLLEKEKLETDITRVEEKISEEEKKRTKIEFETEKAEEGLQKNVEERQKVLAEIERGKAGLDDVHPRMETLFEHREQIEAVSNQIQNDVDRLEAEEAEKEQEVHRLNLSVVRLNGEAKNLDYDIERSEGLIKEIENTITQRLQEMDDAKETIQQQTQETKKNEASLVGFFTKKEKQEKELDTKNDHYQSLKEEYQSREKEVRQVRRDQDETSQVIHNLEMEISDLDHEKKTLKNRIQEAYQLDIETISEQEPIALDEAENQIEDIKRKMKGLGIVNMLALQEHDQEKERLDFLNQQRDDLLSAEKTLKETIQKINETARRRFTDVFTDVRNNFKETFQRFFEGGEADLRLPAEEDPLEAQIEIIARPAGKHFRDLSLLSGGERALTAISLLFALYLVKPSPFCILDEIDAPLDDANVERFIKVLSEYAEKTQFIIVTHNKMTMRVAQSLYGVTMEEEGVSKLVSVKFDDSKDMSQEAA